MADRNASNERGSGSPASREAQQQGYAGARGGPREARPDGGDGGQPPQGSGRTGAHHQQEPRVRKSFEAGRAPSEQGDGPPSPERIARRQQGISARSGSHSPRGERVQGESTRGEPQGGHAREGRHRVQGDRETG